MKFHFVDLNPVLVEAWKKEFQDFKNVSIQCADILKVAKNTIVSPANSYGIMDGGIDEQYTNYFGIRPQLEIQKTIDKLSQEHLKVGQALLVKTGNKKIPYMISAPTMETPGIIPSSNCFFAMSAILKVVKKNQKLVTDVYCPGLGTLTGRVNPETAANEMAAAYTKWINNNNVI